MTKKMEFINSMTKHGKLPEKVLVVLTKLPTGAIETQINTENLPEKIDYICGAYGDDMRLKSNPAIRIVGHTAY